MQTLGIVFAATLIAASSTFAAVETHSVPYSYSLSVNGDLYPRLNVPGFDDQNGQRVLTRVDVRVQNDISATIAIENMTDAPLVDWSVEAQHLVLTGFEREDPEEFGPFAFLGGLSLETLTGTLAANDGVAGAGPDRQTQSNTTTIDSLLEMDASYLKFFSAGGEMKVVIGPFTEFFLADATPYDPFMQTGDALVEFTDLAQTGTLSVIYTYDVVPEPGSALALLGCVAARRRRSA